MPSRQAGEASIRPPLNNVQAYGLKPEDWNKSALTVVVVGASGDLARKKIFPAIFALYHEGMLPEVSMRRCDEPCLGG